MQIQVPNSVVGRDTFHITRQALPHQQKIWFGSGSKDKSAFDAKEFATPKPNKLLMQTLGPVNRYFILQGMPVLRSIPLINAIPGIQGVTKIAEIRIPAQDMAKLKEVVNPKTAAFIGPNHPEFFTDWMIDKEISTWVAPQIASWAAQDIVNSDPVSQAFWLRNNLIANVSGSGGKDYSVNWALQGKAVLLHPEGTVRWTADKVHKLFPGIVTMAFEAAKHSLDGDQRPVYMVPMVWKLQFKEDVSDGLHAEMAEIERKLGLPSENGQSAGDRFFNLQKNILAQRKQMFDLPDTLKNKLVTNDNFFEHQEEIRDYILGYLENKYGKQHGDLSRRMYQLGKAIKAQKPGSQEETKKDRRMLDEAKRLTGFSADVYNTPKLTQEQIAESLKRIKQDPSFRRNRQGTLWERIKPFLLLDKLEKFKDGLQKVIPVPVGPRVAHLRVAEPIELTSLLKPGLTFASEEMLKSELLEQFQERLQTTLDEINYQIAPEVNRYSHPNRFYRPLALSDTTEN
jgi:hypothetical protein